MGKQKLAEATKAEDLGDADLWNDMLDVFRGFCGETCDGREFSKLCKECELFDKKFTAQDADLVFTSVKQQGQRVMGYEEFKLAIGKIAKKKGIETQAVQQQIKKTGGPKWSGTKTDTVRFHDDKSTYTGAHASNEKHSTETGIAASERSKEGRKQKHA